MNIIKNEFWALIPARKGSKSIKNKNLLKLNKIPLIGYSLISAKKNKLIKKIIFSSDSKRYFNIAKKFGYDIAHFRGKKTSNDKADDLMIFKDFVKMFNVNNNYLPEFFLHFRPTTPLRKNRTITKAIKIMKKNKKNYTSLRSVRLMPESSYKSLRIVDKKLSSIIKKDFNLDKYNKSRHLYTKTYEADGIVDIYKTTNFLKNTLLGKKVYPLINSDIFSNIDTKEQYKNVSLILKDKKNIKKFT